jgi:hypothetical protein
MNNAASEINKMNTEFQKIEAALISLVNKQQLSFEERKQQKLKLQKEKPNKNLRFIIRKKSQMQDIIIEAGNYNVTIS